MLQLRYSYPYLYAVSLLLLHIIIYLSQGPNKNSHFILSDSIKYSPRASIPMLYISSSSLIIYYTPFAVILICPHFFVSQIFSTNTSLLSLGRRLILSEIFLFLMFWQITKMLNSISSSATFLKINLRRISPLCIKEIDSCIFSENKLVVFLFLSKPYSSIYSDSVGFSTFVSYGYFLY